MDCKEFSNLLDAHLDGALPDADEKRLQDHAAECASCAALLALRQDCRRLDEEIQVPDSFSSSWRRMIREEEAMEEKKKRRAQWKGWAAAAAALVFLIGGTLATRGSMTPRTVRSSDGGQYSYTAPSTAAGGLAASYKRTADSGAVSNFAFDDMEVPMEAAAMYEEAEYDMAAEEPAEANGAREEKIIRNASFTLKTTDYDGDMQRLKDLTAEKGGRVEYLSSYGDASSGQTRSATLTLRIPAQALDDFLAGAQGIGNVTAMTQEMQDVSDSYYDIETRLQTQKEKMTRLQSMIQSAEDVSDLIDIESAIADTQYYIDRYTGQLKSYDGKVDYSTVSVSVREVKITEMKEVTLGERILNGLSDSLESGLEFLEDMAVFLVSALPWLAALAIAALAVRLIVKKKKNRKDDTK